MEIILKLVAALLTFGASVTTEQRCLRFRVHWGKAHVDICVGYGCAAIAPAPVVKARAARKPRQTELAFVGDGPHR